MNVKNVLTPHFTGTLLDSEGKKLRNTSHFNDMILLQALVGAIKDEIPGEERKSGEGKLFISKPARNIAFPHTYNVQINPSASGDEFIINKKVLNDDGSPLTDNTYSLKSAEMDEFAAEALKFIKSVVSPEVEK